MKNKTHTYAAYKRPISDLGTHRDWNLGNDRNYGIPHKLNSNKAAVPAVAQQVKKLTGIHEVWSADLIPDLAQWVKDLA